MKTKNRKNGFDHVTEFECLKQDLRKKNPIYAQAMVYMELLREEISGSLFNVLKKTLAGFNKDMQIEIAEDLMHFACQHTLFTTSCYSVDLVLNICYMMIAEEQGFATGGVKRQFLVLCSGD